jgi:hypothetical protein
MVLLQIVIAVTIVKWDSSQPMCIFLYAILTLYKSFHIDIPDDDPYVDQNM